MRFSDLQQRLLVTLQAKIRGGEITESGLARLTGISQPHIHNAVKGVRHLSPKLSDVLLDALGLTLADLITPTPAGYQPVLFTTVPLLDAPAGPGHPARFDSASSRLAIPLSLIDGLADPWVLRLAPDPALAPPFGEAALVLVDRMAASAAVDSLYLIDDKGGSVVRRAGPGTAVRAQVVQLLGWAIR